MFLLKILRWTCLLTSATMWLELKSDKIVSLCACMHFTELVHKQIYGNLIFVFSNTWIHFQIIIGVFTLWLFAKKGSFKKMLQERFDIFKFIRDKQNYNQFSEKNNVVISNKPSAKISDGASLNSSANKQKVKGRF